MAASVARNQSPGMRAGVRVLLVDDDLEQLAALSILLRDRGLTVETARSGTDALAQIAQAAPDVLVVDAAMPDINGLEVIRRAHLMHPGLPAILLTGYGRQAIDDALAAVRAAYLAKPVDLGALFDVLARAVDVR
jgi:DNA-binding NtrC family response regulator